MKLYGSYTSPFVRHCRIVLQETKTACEFVETDAAASAEKSPTKRVPFLQDGNVFFTDSSSIIKYLREKSCGDFLSDAKQLDEFSLINTALDSTINLFYIERDGVKISEVPYLQRQAERITSILTEINTFTLPTSQPYNDVHLRLACYIGWAKFRNRVDFSPFKNLEKFYLGMTEYKYFIETDPEH